MTILGPVDGQGAYSIPSGISGRKKPGPRGRVSGYQYSRSIAHGRGGERQATAHVALVQLQGQVLIAVMLGRLGAYLAVAGGVALHEGLEAAPFQALRRPGR